MGGVFCFLFWGVFWGLSGVGLVLFCYCLGTVLLEVVSMFSLVFLVLGDESGKDSACWRRAGRVCGC